MILDSNNAYVLQADKIQGKWWLELVERSTGEVQTVICNTKQHAIKLFKGMSLEEVKEWLDRAKFDKIKVYKPNYNVN